MLQNTSQPFLGMQKQRLLYLCKLHIPNKSSPNPYELRNFQTLMVYTVHSKYHRMRKCLNFHVSASSARIVTNYYMTKEGRNETFFHRTR